MSRLMVMGLTFIGRLAVPVIEAWEWWKLPHRVRRKIGDLLDVGATVRILSRAPELLCIVRLDGREMLMHGTVLYGAVRRGRFPMGEFLEIHPASVRVTDGRPLYWARDAYGWFPVHGNDGRTFRFPRIAVRGSDPDGDAVVWANDVAGWHRCKGLKKMPGGPWQKAPYAQRVEGGTVVPLFDEDDTAPTTIGNATVN